MELRRREEEERAERDWCIVENITESTVSPMRLFFMMPWSFFQPSHSKSGTVNSRKSTSL